MRVVKSKQAGDTLVEVLVALTIVGLVVAGAYATANRSLALTRAAQERAEATKIVESQIEQFKYAIAEGPIDSQIMDGNSPFCIADSGGVIAFSANPALPLLEVANLTTEATGGPYSSDCVIAQRYHVYARGAATSNRFTFNVRWERFTGGFDEIEIVYGVWLP